MTFSSSGRLLGHTLLFGLASSCIALPLGWGLAFLLYRSDVAGRRVVRSLFLGMLFVPIHVQVAAWDAGWGLNGWISQRWRTDLAILQGWTGAVWVHAVTSVPWVLLILAIGMRRIPGRFEEEALLYGHPGQVLRRVTIPMSAAAIFAGVIWVFIGAANEISVTDVYQIPTYAEQIYTGFALGDNLTEVQNRVLPGSLMILAVMGTALFLGRRVSPAGFAAPPAERFVFPLGRWRWMLSLLLMGLVVLLIVMPLASLCWKAGVVVSPTATGLTRSWSLGRLVSVVVTSPVRFAEELAWSIALGQASSLMAVGLAFAIALARGNRPVRWVGIAFALVGISVPAPVLAIVASHLVSHSGSSILTYLYDRTIFLAWMVLWIRSFPLAYVLAHAVVGTIDRRLHEAAAVDGAAWLQRVRTIDLPQLTSPIIGTWVICLAWGMTELSGTILALPPGITTLSIRIFNLVHYGVDDQLAGICLIHVIGCGLLAAIGTMMLRGRRMT
jgi:iron(III) transport system permease protein